ncbi:FitA-like ribbon-helix-helix domain-containing protein [Polaromonas sp. YR568]|uniref:FitA-like ribbon-helix-helix domain-containing protein n=1 Tax=Polaromonas sp. YR568 TaxID=1855301 RepID=UPI00398BFE88
MPNLSIKDVPEDWAQALRLRAARHHRSLQGELMAMVEQAVTEGSAQQADAPGERGRPRIVAYDQRGWPIVRQGWKTPEEVVASMREKFPKPIAGQLSSIDIIRQDRDSR